MNNTQQNLPGQPVQSKDAPGDQHHATHKEAKTPSSPQHKDTEIRNTSHSSGQSVQANTINNTLNDMFKAATIVQQIMTELNGAVTEEQKIAAITRIVLKLMKENGR
jgi:activator of HSP90 ATPase